MAVHIYNQRAVAGLNKCTRAVPFDRINTREVHSSQLGPMPVALRKLPMRLDQIPFYDTQYMVDPASPLTRQTFTSTLTSTMDDEPWDSPLQRNPSMTTHLMTYNAYKKEQACQTNWDRMGESDVIYNQNFYRDPNIMRRNQMQMQMNAYNSYNNYNNNNAFPPWQGMRTGSRRNSLKNYAAPPPPPMPSNMLNRQMNQQNMRNSYPPAQNPVNELQNLMGRRDNYDENSEEPPFNFKAMLRKTNYNRPENNSTTYEFNENNQTFQQPKLRPTGRRFEDNSLPQYGAAKFNQRDVSPVNQQNSSYSNNYTTDEAGANNEEEYEI